MWLPKDVITKWGKSGAHPKRRLYEKDMLGEINRHGVDDLSVAIVVRRNFRNKISLD